MSERKYPIGVTGPLTSWTFTKADDEPVKLGMALRYSSKPYVVSTAHLMLSVLAETPTELAARQRRIEAMAVLMSLPGMYEGMSRAEMMQRLRDYAASKGWRLPRVCRGGPFASATCSDGPFFREVETGEIWEMSMSVEALGELVDRELP